MEQDDRFGVWVRSVAEVIDVTVRTEATDDGGARRGVNGVALVADGDFAVIADPDSGLLTPDVGPPRTLWRGAEDGAFFSECLLLGRVRGLAEFAVDFILVGVGDELVEQMVRPGDFEDVIGGQKWHEAFLPVVVTTFDFAFGLGRWGIAQFDAVEVEGLAELGEGFGVVRVEERMVVHVEGQGQTVSLKDARKEVEVSEQGFGGIEACAGVEASGVVEDVQQDLLVVCAGQTSVRAGVVLPERPVIAGLPAFDGFANGFVAGIGVELMGDGPTADAGAVGFEVESPVEFAGDGTVGARGFCGEEFGGQGGGFGGPIRMVIATGESGGPGLALALSAGTEVMGVEFVETGASQSQFGGGGASAELADAETGEQMTDERSGQTLDEL